MSDDTDLVTVQVLECEHSTLSWENALDGYMIPLALLSRCTSHLDDLGPLVVDLSVRGGQQGQQHQRDDELQDPGGSGRVVQPVDQADGGPGGDQADDAGHPPGHNHALHR